MAQRIKAMLYDRGISVAAFARLVGISQPALNRIVNGEVPLSGITVCNFMKIANGLGISAEELFYDDAHRMEGKAELLAAFQTTSDEGRAAMLANARGVLASYPRDDGAFLPEFRES